MNLAVVGEGYSPSRPTVGSAPPDLMRVCGAYILLVLTNFYNKL